MYVITGTDEYADVLIADAIVIEEGGNVRMCVDGKEDVYIEERPVTITNG
jgi:hypothetical protein